MGQPVSLILKCQEMQEGWDFIFFHAVG